MGRSLSLANKCQILFGAAVVLIIAATLVIPWNRLVTIVDQLEEERSRQIARLWESNLLIDPAFARLLRSEEEAAKLERELLIRYYPGSEWIAADFPAGGFEAVARERFGADDPPDEHSEAIWGDDRRLYRFARRLTDSGGVFTGVLVIERRSVVAASQVFVNRLYFVIAGLGAGVLAVLVFYLITTRLILGPVRALKETADTIKAGNPHARADIRTGDEFEQLSEAFNSMLENLGAQQTQLRGINKSLDLKLTELAERNVALYEAARLKGEFLANISHELRTPLNSIIGFAEILQEFARADEARVAEAGPDGDASVLAKRRRYLDNIVNAGRALLEMINELLTMAKIDAGNVDVQAQRMNVAETCEGLLALIKPLADRKGIALSLQLQSSDGAGFTDRAAAVDLPAIETDPQKFQQIVFNFLSNAVKFTPESGEVTLRAERMLGADGETRLRVSVLDTGPGIPADRHAEIFEKFTQLESAHTKTHQGTGLGLAIARDFAEMLQGEIRLVSEVGHGSMFSLIVPARLDASRLGAPDRPPGAAILAERRDRPRAGVSDRRPPRGGAPAPA